MHEFRPHSPCTHFQAFLSGDRLYVQALVLALYLGLSTQNCWASNGDSLVVPQTRVGTPTYSMQSGLQIKVDSTWTGNRGYRPINVTATMSKPATSDTLITINFTAGNWQNGNKGISVEYDFELPQGASSSSASFSVPQYVDWNIFSWEIWVDGVKDEELCQIGLGFNSGNSATTTVGALNTSRPNVNQPTVFGLIENGSHDMLTLDPANLPDRWVDYSPLDVITTTLPALELLRVTSPEKLAKLMRWVRTGGNLWVMEMGQDFTDLIELEKILTPNSESDPSEADSRLAAWRFLKLGDSGRARIEGLIRLSMEDSEEGELSSLEIEDRDDPSIAADSRSWFSARAFGLGMVVAFQSDRTDNAFDLEQTVVALGRTSLTENLNWATRHGNDPATGNPNFNNLLIPDVGTAPVFEFQMLISLFVIGIGPVNYWMLKRRNQLPLLLVTVPLAALVATLMLFSYGVLADGIGVRVRVRSMTLLDQRASEVASWARMSYYAGIAPSDGLQMPIDTTLYPILPARSNNHGIGRQYVNQQRSLEWNEQQQLQRGWLASRTPTQYLAITARATNKRLQFDKPSEPLTVTNLLDTQVIALVVQDHAGNIFIGDSLDVEGSAELKPSTYIKAASLIRRHLTENTPQMPAGYINRSRSRRDNYAVPLTDSLLELQFEAIVSPTAKGWGNGTYLAITTSGIEIPLGVENATESSSFHVVRGTW